MKRLLLSLLSLSLLASNLSAMELPNQRPIIKAENAVEASQETKDFFKQVFLEYGLNPNDYKVLNFYDPNYFAGADANSITNVIRINDAKCAGNFNPDNYLDWFKIYTTYHEIGHIKDRAAQKIKIASILASTATYFTLTAVGLLSKNLLSSRYPNSPLFQPIQLNISNKSILIPDTWSLGSIGISFLSSISASDYASKRESGISEIRANNLACEQLLKKSWGLGPIAANLSSLKYSELKKIKCGNHNVNAEYKNIVKFLNKHGYEVDHVIQDKIMTVAIKKNGNILTQHSSSI